MSLHVEVIRGAGDNQCPEDIVLEYFKAQATAREVGRVAIDRSTKGLKRVSGVLFGVRPFYAPGDVIRHLDMRQGDCVGMVEDFSGTIAVDESGVPQASVGLTFRRLAP